MHQLIMGPLHPLIQPLTYEQQLDNLMEQGMLVANKGAAMNTLASINYYRLTAYAYQWKHNDGKYKEGTTFEKMLMIYTWDIRLRHVLLSALEHLEIAVRTRVAYEFALAYGPDGHYEAKNFVRADVHKQFIAILHQQIKNNVRSPFVAHHIKKYGGRMPLWVAVEILSFSTISKFYRNLLPDDQKRIAQSMGVRKVQAFSNYLQCLSDLRNQCAHYGRLYNKPLTKPMMISRKDKAAFPKVANNTLLGYIIGMAQLMGRTPQRKQTLLDLSSLLSEFAPHIELARAGLLGYEDCFRRLI